MSTTVTLRLPDDVAEWLRESASRSGRSVNEVGVTLLEEARRAAEFGEIEFRSFQGERHACVKGHMQVWQVISVAQDYDLDAAKTAEHLGWPEWRVQAALGYYHAFPEEIDRAIAQNRALTPERLQRLLPQLRLLEAPMDAGRASVMEAP